MNYSSTTNYQGHVFPFACQQKMPGKGRIFVVIGTRLNIDLFKRGK